ncbi:sensor histidine kinase [Blastococcus sp. VKM Ac-2987]|uniref:sensor histidine kinase n=1 Tax=Blastococcus sp. VKM Ac-2987 TaxID=3004141 RepID=UPI0022AB9561|nr:sensor histidine kinase [Blastococcus sp. VKM Ac-2987]MCZ2857962.1 sensor histidine kinase [Blastococcus sp. VKM Ac-2987]
MPTVTRWWGSRSDPERIELYTRWSFYSLLGALPLFAVAVLGSAAEPVPDLAVGLFVAGAVATAVGGVLVTRRGLAAHRRGEPLPYRTVAGAFAAAGLMAAAGAWAFGTGGSTPAVPWSVALPLGTVLTACATVWTTRQLLPHTVTIGVLSGFAGHLDGTPAPAAVAQGIALTLAVIGVVLAFRFSVWVLDVVQETARSRGVALQLALAEERLRFARDLHDVMGRDLSTIAVKSQLAGELVRRGQPGAAEELGDIARIAEGSLREVREVVRGYRSADLAGELAGARSVLRAAGVACTVVGEDAGAGLPPQVHTALGWVVREAVTNVLRHSRAAECTITLSVTSEEVRLSVVNDGAGEAGPGRGNGLTGLAERLAGLDGRLSARSAGGRFLLDATLPRVPA